MEGAGGISKFFEFGDLNQGNEAAFYSGGWLEVIDITVGHFGLRESIIGYVITSEHSLSNHRYIRFTLQCSVPLRLIRNPSGTNWGFLRGDLKDRMVRALKLNLKNEAGLWLVIFWFKQDVISN